MGKTEKSGRKQLSKKKKKRSGRTRPDRAKLPVIVFRHGGLRDSNRSLAARPGRVFEGVAKRLGTVNWKR